MRFLRQVRLPFTCTLLATATTTLTGCTVTVPLGGVSVGRGRPIGELRLEGGMSVGQMAELLGTFPEMLDASGEVANPVPPRDSLRSPRAGWDPLGVVFGFTGDVDVGINFSRGLHAVVRVLHGDRWALSVSPAVFRYTNGGSLGHLVEVRARVTNVNLTTLGAFKPWPGHTWVPDFYGGAGLTRYGGFIEAEDQRVDHAAVVPTLLAGFNLVVDDSKKKEYTSINAEVVGAWVTQRNGRRDFFPALRVYVGYGFYGERPRLGQRRLP